MTEERLLIDVWAVIITVMGLRKLLKVPVWLGAVVYILAIATAVPLAIMFMRFPL